MKRVLCVWFPDFPMQRLHCQQPELRAKACVLFRESGNRASVVMACRQAQQRGVVAGTPLAEAQALLESACFLPLDAVADEEALRGLAHLCDRYSPLIGIEPFGEPHQSTSSCLLLEIGSCAHLFGGESHLARQLIMEFSRQGYFAHVGIAETVGAAWGLACYGHRVRAGRTGAQAAPFLTALPMEALRLPDKLLETLAEFDLRTVGQLADLPRESLPSRFGQLLTDRLDQMYGRQDELLAPVSPPEPVWASWTAEDSCCEAKHAGLICEDLLVEILNQLESRSEGLLRLLILFKSESAEPRPLEIGFLRPADSVKHIMGLIDLKLETEPIPEWLAGIEMQAVVIAPMRVQQQSLFEMVPRLAGKNQASDTNQLIDRLSARLGNQAVVRPRLLAEYRPEYAVGTEPLTTQAAKTQSTTTQPTRAQSTKNQSTKTQSTAIRATMAETVPARPAQVHSVSSGSTKLPAAQVSSIAGESSGVGWPAGGGGRFGTFSARPLFLLPEPERIHVVVPASATDPAIIHWNGNRFRVRYFTRSERISTDWWREGGMVRRKYYQAETETGSRFWLFHDPSGTWFLHGLFE